MADKSGFLEVSGISDLAMSLVINHVIDRLDGFSLNALYNNSASIYTGRKSTGINDPNPTLRFGGSHKTKKLSINRNTYEELYSVEKIQNYIGIHEGIAHVVLGYTDRGEINTHYKAYQLQRHSTTFSALSKSDQKEIEFRMNQDNWYYVPGNNKWYIKE